MGGKKKPGADLPDGHGTPGGQHLPDVNDSDAMDWSTKLGMARMITELHDQVDTPVGVLIPLLNSTIAAKSQAVNGYRAEMTGPGVYDIVQFTKKKRDPAKVKEGFTTNPETEKPKGLRTIVESREASRIIDRLSPALKAEVDATIELLLRDQPGRNQHVLTGDLQGFWAADVRGSGRGRGSLRIVYSKSDSQLIIHSIEDYH